MLILSDISQEYYEIGVNFKLNVEDIKNILLNTIDNIFEKDEEIRNKLKDKVNTFYDD